MEDCIDGMDENQQFCSNRRGRQLDLDLDTHQGDEEGEHLLIMVTILACAVVTLLLSSGFVMLYRLRLKRAVSKASCLKILLC